MIADVRAQSLGRSIWDAMTDGMLGITERTARTHVSNILGKLGLDSRTQAALFAVREGLTTPSP
jgi:hypothetical protein